MTWSKRIFDLVASFLGLLLLSPLFLLIGALVKLEDGGPIFYKQRRVGYQGRKFTIWKFRSMRVDADKAGPSITFGEDPRITRVGKWLRKTKLDELPQLFNVFRGEMSFVGPRPEVPEYVAMYTPEQRVVLNLLPGITDPASLKYRNESEFLATSPDPLETYVSVVMPDKIRINLEYSHSANILSDIWIILKTVTSALFPGDAKGT